MITSFQDFALNKQLLQAIEEMGYKQPTPIQVQAIPTILNGQDLLGIAQTGTGKTAAFVLPMLMKIKYAQGKDPRALIVAPTRELVIQIDEQIKQLGKYTDLRNLALYGGTGIKKQAELLEKGVDIITATPGRLMDLYLSGNLWLKNVQMFVIDEADRMMDMGFMPQIRRILEVIPQKKRQNLLFSATFPQKVEQFSQEFLEFPIRIEITPAATTAVTVQQYKYELPNFQSKLNVLIDFLQDTEKWQRVLVFARSRQNVNQIFQALQGQVKGEMRVLHANKDQNTRLNAIKEFESGKVRVLIATDIAARGLDVEKVTQVVNFEVPMQYEDYVHRIGRTGRAGESGEAYTFYNEAEKYHIEKIEKVIKKIIPLKTVSSHLVAKNTPFDEKQAIALEIDRQKRKENPDFKGAFHEKQAKAKKKEVKNKAVKNKK